MWQRRKTELPPRIAPKPRVGSLWDLPILSTVEDLGTSALDAGDKFFSNGPLGDFFKSGVGKALVSTVLTAASSGVYAGLGSASVMLPGGVQAVGIGPQLASVAFAIPGLVRGDNFTQAYIEGVLDRVAKTVSNLAPGLAEKVGAEISEQIQPVVDDLKAHLPNLDDVDIPYLPKLSISDLAQSHGLSPDASYADMAQNLGIPLDQATPEGIAKAVGAPDMAVNLLAGKLNVRQDATAYAKAAVLRKIPPPEAIVESLTGLIKVPIGSGTETSRALGIPEGNYVPSSFPAPGSTAYLLPNTISDGVRTWMPGSLVTVIADDSANHPFGVYYQIRNADGGLGVVPGNVLTLTPPPPPANLPVMVGNLTLDVNGNVQSTAPNMSILNTILNAMKADSGIMLNVPKSAATWLTAHGIAGSRLPVMSDVVSLDGSLRQIVLNPNGSLQSTTGNMAALNNAMLLLKANKTATITVPAAVAKWLAEHGIAPSRMSVMIPRADQPHVPPPALRPPTDAENAMYLASAAPPFPSPGSHAWMIATVPGAPPVGYHVKVTGESPVTRGKYLIVDDQGKNSAAPSAALSAKPPPSVASSRLPPSTMSRPEQLSKRDKWVRYYTT